VEEYNKRLNELLAIKFGEHDILIYEDIDIFDKVYSKYCKHQLSISNHVVLLLIFNEDEETVLQNLSNEGVDVEKRKADGSLLIEILFWSSLVREPTCLNIYRFFRNTLRK
jgi:hypothetical protein